MKKILLMFFIGIFIVVGAEAARNQATTTTYKSSQLIKRFEGKVYSVSFVATSNGGNFILYNALSATEDITDIKAEGSEATSANGHFQNYSEKPLEFTTGLYLSITNGYIIISYE